MRRHSTYSILLDWNVFIMKLFEKESFKAFFLFQRKIANWVRNSKINLRSIVVSHSASKLSDKIVK